MDKNQVAEILVEIGVVLELLDEDERAAAPRRVGDHPEQTHLIGSCEPCTLFLQPA